MIQLHCVYSMLDVLFLIGGQVKTSRWFACPYCDMNHFRDRGGRCLGFQRLTQRWCRWRRVQAVPEAADLEERSGDVGVASRNPRVRPLRCPCVAARAERPWPDRSRDHQCHISHGPSGNLDDPDYESEDVVPSSRITRLRSRGLAERQEARRSPRSSAASSDCSPANSGPRCAPSDKPARTSQRQLDSYRSINAGPLFTYRTPTHVHRGTGDRASPSGTNTLYLSPR